MRRIVVLVAVLGLVAGLVVVKAKQIGTLVEFGKAAEISGPPPEVVSTARAKEEAWEATLSAVGSVESVKGVTLSNEVPGVVSAIRFESGATVKKGDILVELDASVERAQLGSAYARKQLAASNLARNKGLVAVNALAGAQLDADEAAVKTADSDAAALQAQIARKSVRAPFGGKLGIRSVNLGQYLQPGTPLAVLETTDAEYVDFTLPQQRLAELVVGMPVRLTPNGADATVTVDATLAAIDPTLDPITRSVRLRASAPDEDHKLRPGMFVRVAVILPAKKRAVVVPVTAMIYASYGNSVFVVEEKLGPNGQPVKVARQQFVRSGETRGDFIAIEDGLKPNEEIVTAGAFKLRNGGGVLVKNEGTESSKAAPKLDPRPENH